MKQLPKVRIDSHGFPESFALTETDREYFNIIKTEDGTSDFIRLCIMVWSNSFLTFNESIIFMARKYLFNAARDLTNINCSTFRGPVDKTLSRKDERSKNLDKTQGQEHIQENNNGQEVSSHQHKTPSFRYHLVSTNSSRPIVGIYLPEGSN